MSSQPTPLQQLQIATQANKLANDLIRSQAIEMQTQLPPIALSNAINNSGQQVNVIPRNVGLLKGFFVEFNATIKNNNAVDPMFVNLSQLSAANFFSNVMFTDLQNNVRINCPSYQLVLLNTIKNKAPFGMAISFNSYDAGTIQWFDGQASVQGSVGLVPWHAPTTALAPGASSYISGVMHIPIAYSDHDYRGAIYSNVINGQMGLQLTINPAPAFLAGKTPMLCIGGPGDTSTSLQILNTQIVVTQVYMDQLPIDPKSGLPILPQRDISTIYELKNTTFTGAVSGNDFPMQYPNFRDVLSSIVLFDNPGLGPPTTQFAGQNNTTPQITNYFSLQAANSTNIFRRTANLNNVMTRAVIGTDMPFGIAYFSYRGKPLSTTQYGNLQLIFNPNATWLQTSPIYHCWESFASIATISQAGSLAAGS